jgi:hypothetical protein
MAPVRSLLLTVALALAFAAQAGLAQMGAQLHPDTLVFYDAGGNVAAEVDASGTSLSVASTGGDVQLAAGSASLRLGADGGLRLGAPPSGMLPPCTPTTFGTIAMDSMTGGPVVCARSADAGAGRWQSLAGSGCTSGYFEEGVIKRIPTRGVSSVGVLRGRPPASMGLSADVIIGVGNYNAASGGYDQDAQFYMLQGSEWTLLQTIATQGVVDVELWTIGSDVYAGVANYVGNSGGQSQTSRIYRWNAASRTFGSPQGIAIQGGYDLEPFVIGGRPMLAIASHYTGSSYNTNSVVYGFNAGTGLYVLNQTLATRGATKFKSFVAGGESYLLVTNFASGGGSYSTDSELWRWNAFAGQFVSQQLIPTTGAFGCDVFVHGGMTYAAIANYYTGSTTVTPSNVYAFNPALRTFSVVASVTTYGAKDVMALSLGGATKLWFASNQNSGAPATTSVLYGFNATTLVREQSIPTFGTERVSAAWMPVDGGDSLLVFAQDHYDGTTFNLQVRTLEWRCRPFVAR